ncbi:MAG: sporulation initiation factor Spo0A C-terminal domain-containing protein [Oscillospiraceae bacterium]
MNRTIERVLICDGTEEYGQTFAGLLIQQGYSVDICECSEENEMLLQYNAAPDCVIVDDSFSCSDNIALIRLVRDIGSAPLVVFLSSVYSDSLRMEINSLDNALFLEKPIDAQSVVQSIREAESLRRSRLSDCVRASVSDSEIDDLLCGLGFSMKLKGFGFLKECIYATLEKPELLGSISRKLYPCVGERVGTAPTSVEKNIRASISMAFREDRSRNLQSFVNSCKCPTNGAVIRALYDHYAAAE